MNDEKNTTTSATEKQSRVDEDLRAEPGELANQRVKDGAERFTSNAYDLVIDGESYRARQKPALSRSSKTGSRRAA